MDSAALKKPSASLDFARAGANDAQRMKGIKVFWILRNNFPVVALRL